MRNLPLPKCVALMACWCAIVCGTPVNWASDTETTVAYRAYRIFFWTARHIEPDDEAKIRFTHRMAPAMGGTLISTVPEQRVPGSYNRPATQLQIESPLRHLTLNSIHRLEQKRYFSELKRQVARSSNKTILIFVHGYDYHFEESAYRAGQFLNDSGFTGTMIMFSWPSYGEIGEEGYRKDVGQAMMSDSGLAEFIAALPQEVPDAKVSVLAHSLGCRLVCSALGQVLAFETEGGQPFLDELIFAAPDVDQRVFVDNLAQTVCAASNRSTIYASRKDVALQLANQFNGNRARLGEMIGEMPDIKGIDLIDASNVHCQSGPLGMGHMYFVDSVEVMRDIVRVLDGAPLVTSVLVANR